MKRCLPLSLLLGLLGCALPGLALAGGMEYAGVGVDALSRGGASVARSTDPTVMRSNPAGLAELSKVQLVLDGQLALHDSCYQPSGYYGWGVYRGGSAFQLPDPRNGQKVRTDLSPGDPYFSDPQDRVCLKQGLNPFESPGLLIPQLAMSVPLGDSLGLGFGLIFPAQMPTGQWGGENGVIRGDDNDLRPSPARYQMLDSQTKGIFPTLGLGWAVTPWLRVGGSLQWGMVQLDQTVMAVLAGGTGPAADIISRVQATDSFVPGATGSIQLVPVSPVDVVMAFRWQGAVDAQGKAYATTGLFSPNSSPFETELEVDHVLQNMPWAATLALRYAKRHRPREAKNDPIEDELWDVEFDLQYEFNSQIDAQAVDPADGQVVTFQAADSGDLTRAEFPSYIRIPKEWRDQYSARLGGSFAILPGVLSLSAGAHYETRGVKPEYAQVDFMPFARFGGHAGLTFRMSEHLPQFFKRSPVDLRLVYSFVQQEDVRVAPPAHASRFDGGFDKTAGAPESRFEDAPVLEEDPRIKAADGTAGLRQVVDKTPPDDPAYIINAGTYSSRLHILGLGALYHF